MLARGWRESFGERQRTKREGQHAVVVFAVVFMITYVRTPSPPLFAGYGTASFQLFSYLKLLSGPSGIHAGAHQCKPGAGDQSWSPGPQ